MIIDFPSGFSPEEHACRKNPNGCGSNPQDLFADVCLDVSHMDSPTVHSLGWSVFCVLLKSADVSRPGKQPLPAGKLTDA